MEMMKKLNDSASLTLILVFAALVSKENAPAEWETFKSGSEQGESTAQSLRGLTDFEGKKVPPDEVSSVKRIPKAAEPGKVAAQKKLEVIYFQGQGGKQIPAAQSLAGAIREKKENAVDSSSDDLFQTIRSLARKMDQGDLAAKEKLREFRKLALNPATDPKFIFALFQAFEKVVAETWDQHPEIEPSPDTMKSPGTILFFKGIGDPEKNIDLLIKEAFFLKMTAQITLYWLYAKGSRDPDKPQFWDRYQPRILNLFQEGAEDGIPRSRYFLAKIYYTGSGVPKDEERAIRLLKGNTIREALELLVGIYLKRGQRDLAMKGLRKAEESGYPFGPYNLGVLLRESGNHELAVQYWEKTLDLDPKYWKAKLNLAQAYSLGQGVKIDKAKAFKFMKEGADEGDPNNPFVMTARYLVGMDYLKGSVTEKSIDQAIKYFSLAAEKGDKEAQFRLGNLYLIGRELPQDFDKAFQWLGKAAEQGLAKAQYNLGIMYLYGKGIPQNFKEAILWIRRAADQDFAPARSLLEEMREKEPK